MNERFWQMMCDSLPLFSLLFVANVVLLVMLTATWAFGDPSGGSAFVSGIALVVIAISLGLSTYVIRRCRS